MKLRTIFFITFGIVLLVAALSPFVLAFGWNRGVVGSIDGAHEISYGRAMLIEGVLGMLGFSSTMFAAIPRLFKSLMQISSTTPAVPVMDPSMFMHAAMMAQAAANMPMQEDVPTQDSAPQEPEPIP